MALQRQSLDDYRQKLRDEFSARLKLLEDTYNKQIKQKQGQRIFGPKKGQKHPVPPRGSEIYVGHLPFATYEDTLIPYFSSVGIIYKMRLMLEFSGLTRNFCFITYNTPEMADRAIRQFHGYNLMGKRLCVYKSIDNSTLHLSGLPLNVQPEQLLQALGDRFKGIIDVEIKRAPRSEKPYSFVTFDSHKHAADARKIMWPVVEVGNIFINVEWAKPRKVPTDKVQSTIYIGNLSQATTKRELMNYMLDYVGGSFTKLDRAVGTDKAVIEFATETYAERALKMINGNHWNGHILYATRAVDTQQKNTPKANYMHSADASQGNGGRRQQRYHGNNFCGNNQSFRNMPSARGNCNRSHQGGQTKGSSVILIKSYF